MAERALLWLALIGLLVMFVWYFMPGARAHSDADWIRRGNYRNPVTEELCCGIGDCERVPVDRVTLRGQGVYDVDGRTIPIEQVLPSEDSQWWVCWKPEVPYSRSRSVRCLFHPVAG